MYGLFVESAARSIGRWLLLGLLAVLSVWAGYKYLTRENVQQAARVEAVSVSEQVRKVVKQDQVAQKARTQIEQPAVEAEARLKLYRKEDDDGNAPVDDQAGAGGAIGLRAGPEYLRVLNDAVAAGNAAQRAASERVP